MFRLHATGPALALGGIGLATPLPPRGSGSRGHTAFRELLLRQDPAELRRARWLAETAASEGGLGSEEAFRFTFAANEAVANAIEHGGASPDGHILVRSSSANGDLTFEVHDWGSFAPDVSEAEALPERGRGLALMATMVDEVDVKPSADVTVVRLVMRAPALAA
jgi:anti-sigma regulatory factor (Ser/Thr protein kinase)